MIQTIRRVRVCCDWCGEPGPEGTNTDEARALASVTGWVKAHWYGDIYHRCPSCLADPSRPLNPLRGARITPALDLMVQTNPNLTVEPRRTT